MGDNETSEKQGRRRRRDKPTKGESESVKVAVRVRPFLPREESASSRLIVDMKGNQTIITNPQNGDEKEFAFDYSYWSFDGFKKDAAGQCVPDPSHPNGGKYAGQTKVFDDLGETILSNAWEGYNSTLFAYGQTGSGKSYSVVGFGADEGIMPIFARRLFEEIENRGSSSDEPRIYEVTFSMIEIYNEVTRDLLNMRSDRKGLKIREKAGKGFYCEKLKVVPVESYESISRRIHEGKRNRTIKSTNMNESSSRAHTIIGITFTQKKKNSKGEEVSKSSIINLVDLAGSERQERTGATGDRLKEGAAINLSLTCLGKCISALAESSAGKKVKVPYRDSVLTKLLMNALGGNSKTVMIAAISPAHQDYEESLSTLRYADSAKQIKTSAVINEDPTETLIRELQEENAKLKAMLESGVTRAPREEGEEDGAEEGDDDEDDVQARIEENELQIANMQKSFEERLEEAHAAATGQTQQELNELKDTYPYLRNLNSDPMLDGMIVHIIRNDNTLVGNPSEDSMPEIVLMGPSINEQHALISADNKFRRIEVQVLGDGRNKVVVNGRPVSDAAELHHGDRILFGVTQLYVFINPIEARKLKVEIDPPVSFDDAQDEIARNSGYNNEVQRSSEDAKLHHEISQIFPAIEEANMISEKLDRLTKFEMVVVPPELLGLDGNQSQVFVRVRNFSNGLIYDWPQEKFMDRFVLIQGMYDKFADGDEWRVPDKEDPFTEPIDMRARVGTVCVFLKSVAYFIKAAGQFEITDIRGNEVGVLNVEVIPVDEKGNPMDNEVWINNPSSLIGEDIHFIFRINYARGLPPRFTDVQARYRVFLDQNFTETRLISDDCNPNFNHDKMFSFKPMTNDVLNYLLEGKVVVELWGLQVPIKRNVVHDTQVVMDVESLSGQQGYRIIDVDKHKLQMEVDVLKKKSEMTDEKMHYLQQMLKFADIKGSTSLPTNQIQGVLESTTSESIQRWANVQDMPNGLKKKPYSANVVVPRPGAEGRPGTAAEQGKNKSSSSCVVC